jgi:hypothetical protein
MKHTTRLLPEVKPVFSGLDLLFVVFSFVHSRGRKFETLRRKYRHDLESRFQ